MRSSKRSFAHATCSFSAESEWRVIVRVGRGKFGGAPHTRIHSTVWQGRRVTVGKHASQRDAGECARVAIEPGPLRSLAGDRLVRDPLCDPLVFERRQANLKVDPQVLHEFVAHELTKRPAIDAT